MHPQSHSTRVLSVPSVGSVSTAPSHRSPQWRRWDDPSLLIARELGLRHSLATHLLVFKGLLKMSKLV